MNSMTSIVVKSHLLLIAGLSLFHGCRIECTSPCTVQLIDIAEAIVRFRETENTLPSPAIYDADGNIMHSWRVLVLPYVKANRFCSEYDFGEPWNSESNIKLHSLFSSLSGDSRKGVVAAAETYQCLGVDKPAPLGMTNFVMVFFDEGRKVPYRGITGHRNGWQALANPNGELLVVAIDNQGVHWTEPRDLSLNGHHFTNDKNVWSRYSQRIYGGVLVNLNGDITLLDANAVEQEMHRIKHLFENTEKLNKTQ